MITDEYRSSAKFYDRLISPLLINVRRNICTFINYKGYRKVIDFCCGTGNQLLLLDSPDRELCGIDNSISMLEQAKKKCGNSIEFHLLDAESDTFSPGLFDCAIISFALHEKHPTISDSIFNNCRKVVRQGGSLIIADYAQVSSGASSMFFGDFLIPIIERGAGKKHYGHYLDWKNSGALEGFLDRQKDSCEIISQHFGSAVLCCALTIDDEIRSKNRSYALLNQSLT